MFSRKMIYKKSITVKIFPENVFLPTKLSLSDPEIYITFAPVSGSKSSFSKEDTGFLDNTIFPE